MVMCMSKKDVDHALVSSVASGVLVNSRHLLENLVFTTLRRLSPHIYYCKTHREDWQFLFSFLLVFVIFFIKIYPSRFATRDRQCVIDRLNDFLVV